MASNFDTQLAKRTFKGNIVLCITDNDANTTYFSQHLVDSGLTVDYPGYVIDASVNGEKLDLRDVKTSIPSLTFSLLDKNKDVSTIVGSDVNGLMDYKVEFYYGFITGSYGWGNYELISTTNIIGMSKSANKYTFNSQAPTGGLRSEIYTTSNILDGNIDEIVTTISLIDASDFSSSGIAYIDGEFITFSGKSDNDLTGVVRGFLSSEASSHDNSEDVFEVTLIEDESMDIALNIILTQVGIDSALVDSDSFTDLRDGDLSGDGDLKFYVWNISSALTWLEENILIATNTRLVNKGGKISIALLDQVAFAADSESITESHIIGDPTYRVDVNRVVNKIIIKYDFNYATDKFDKVQEYTDDNSITNFGEKAPLTLELKGVTSANNGIGFANSKSRKLLARLSSPRAEIKVKTLFNRFIIEPADQVFVEHRYLPQPGTGGEFNYMLEVLAKAPKNFKDNPVNDFTLSFTSYTNVRAGLISPSPLISSVTSQKIFTVPDITYFEVGYYLRLWEDSAKDFYADVANIIVDITGNVITMENNFSTTLTTSIRITFPDYDDSSESQTDKFAYISPNTNEFADGTKAFGILA